MVSVMYDLTVSVYPDESSGCSRESDLSTILLDDRGCRWRVLCECPRHMVASTKMLWSVRLSRRQRMEWLTVYH